MKDFLQKYLPWLLVVILIIILIFFRSCGSGLTPTVEPDKKPHKPAGNFMKATTKSGDVRSISKKDLYTIERFGAGTYIAAGKEGTILTTHNGGIDWKTRASNVTVDLYASASLSYTIFLAAGDKGTIVRSADYGATWNTITTGTTKNIKSLSFPDDLNGFAAGDSGLILKTTDGGQSWTNISVSISYHFNSVCFVNTSTGWFACNGGKILRSTNGGVTLDTLSSGTSKDLKGISFNSLTRGTVVGDDGTILMTKNGGTTWSPMTSGTTNDLRGVHRIGNTLAYIVGDGIIIRENTDSLSVFLADNIYKWYAVDPSPYISGIAVGGAGTMVTVNTVACDNCERKGSHDLMFIPPDEGETNWKVRVRVYQDANYAFKNYFRFILPGFELDNSAINGWTQFDGIGNDPVNVMDYDQNPSGNTNTRHYRKTTAGISSSSQYVDAVTLDVSSINSGYMDFTIRPNSGNNDSTGTFEFYFGECPTSESPTGPGGPVSNPCDLGYMEDMNFCHKITYQLSLKK